MPNEYLQVQCLILLVSFNNFAKYLTFVLKMIFQTVNLNYCHGISAIGYTIRLLKHPHICEENLWISSKTHCCRKNESSQLDR